MRLEMFSNKAPLWKLNTIQWKLNAGLIKLCNKKNCTLCIIFYFLNEAFQYQKATLRLRYS